MTKREQQAEYAAELWNLKSDPNWEARYLQTHWTYPIGVKPLIAVRYDDGTYSVADGEYVPPTDDDEPIDFDFASQFQANDIIAFPSLDHDEYWFLNFEINDTVSVIYVRTRGELRAAVQLAERLRK